ncbi:PQQ-like beta-propeller repeat protein [Polaribacter sp. Q13]|uniref:PQQ-like beta-propeller repeat protein n=1 Tax=Polaribacter sp. Q13 TaxID=2806551 RepID=UPI00193C4CED|nr:PQQ-like beta-propeller repeat protein [Polaribacter sp. Q13]QVY65585.1 PQQ-like beta-propeller repeat protein [Polaribacter sp. Q13]
MKINSLLTLVVSFLVSIQLFAFQSNNFSTKTNNIRNSVVGEINNESILFVSELSKSIAAYTLDGKELWQYKIDQPSVIFEILAQDINNDGNDDLLAVAGNGIVYCIDSKGSLLWQFTPDHKVRLSEIAVVKNDDKIQIFAGGNDYQLYELDTDGKQVSSTKIEGVVRKIESGVFTNSGKESLFVMTYSNDKFRWDFMGILDADTKEVVKQLSPKKKEVKALTKVMITDISIVDINNDKKDDILFFGDASFKPFFSALDADFNVLAQYVGNQKQAQRYAHSQGSFLPSRNEIMFQHGGILIVLDTKGKVIHIAGERYGKGVYSDFVYEPKSNQLIAAGTVDGGNNVDFYDLSKNSWSKTSYKKQGRMLEVEKNLETLYAQVLEYKTPSYQKKSDKNWVMITKNGEDSKVKKLHGNDIKFVIQKSPKESTDRTYLVNKIGKSALKKDKRGKYKDSREQIVQMARDYEAEGQPFTFWAGHGNDPFYIQIETLEQVLEVAPTTCYGFVYAEMANVEDPRVQLYVKEYLPRLAKAIRKNNRAKLYFRYKNMFWAATSHLPLWKEMFYSGKYSDILAPASEDTSNRIQDLNLAGRIGMRNGGYVNDFAMRLIDDNPTSWRPLSPGGQNSVSPYLRQGVMMAAYGARYGIVSTSGFVEDPGLNILFALMKSGVLPIVEKEDILSIGSWHLIKDIDAELVHTVDNHHDIKQYKKDDDNAVFSVAQMHWAGTSVPESDFSKIALGVDYRWLNYMPETPFGMVPVAPIEFKNELLKKKIPFSISNGKKGFFKNQFVSAKEFAPELKRIVETGAKDLPILVKGAAWSAIKIDENHTRIILLDQGYIEPQDREVTITFQNRNPNFVEDILSKENLKISKNQINLKVPAGSLRFIDVTY